MMFNPSEEVEVKALREKALGIIKFRSFSKGKFKLSSGRDTDFYIDLKPTMFDPNGADCLARLILYYLKDVETDYICGMESGAIPLVSTATAISKQTNRPVPSFFVRKKVKEHGTKNLIEGLSNGETLHGKSVVVLDDVTTTGASAVAATNAAQDAGANVIMIMSVVDREEGAMEYCKIQNISFMSLFKASDFMT